MVVVVAVVVVLGLWLVAGWLQVLVQGVGGGRGLHAERAVETWAVTLLIGMKICF